jgi:hypothetical protein
MPGSRLTPVFSPGDAAEADPIPLPPPALTSFVLVVQIERFSVSFRGGTGEKRGARKSPPL